MKAASLRCGAVGAALVAATVTLAWALARPELPVALAAVRAVSDGAAVVALGLTVVPLLDEPRYRAELGRRARRPLILVGALWLLAELTCLTLTAAAAAGSSVVGLSLPTLLEFATTTPGRAAFFGIGAATVLTLTAAANPGHSHTPALITAGAIGVAGRTVTGHLSDSVLGGVAVAGHALAAALWCGTLAALAITTPARGQWARVLPGFSRLALWCVGGLLAGGVTAALIAVGSPLELCSTGHGRILLAKTAVTGLLLTLANRNRKGWLTAARGHRISAEASQSTAARELAPMAVALTFAAALSVTG